MTWRRDPIPTQVCRCSHSHALHAIDTTRQACSIGGCLCPRFELVALRWTEHRTVTTALDGGTP